jgi:Cu+-exporting ATPase
MSARGFVHRTVIALITVLSLTVYSWTGVEPLKWFGLILYFACFSMYLRSLLISLNRTKKVTADLLVLTVMVVSFLAGQPLSGALVAWFISMGLAISFTIIERTRRKIEALIKGRSRDVHVIRNGKVVDLPVEKVLRGDTVIVPQGEMIPVDGEITEGASSIDESVVTGEPFPVFKKTGNSVTSGAISFNAVGITLATVGLLNPWLAALFHHVSSVLVVLNSARLVRKHYPVL